MHIKLTASMGTQDRVDMQILNGQMLSDESAKVVIGALADGTSKHPLDLLHSGEPVHMSDLAWALRIKLADTNLPVETVTELAALAIWAVEQAEIAADAEVTEALELVDTATRKVALAERRVKEMEKLETKARATVFLIRRGVTCFGTADKERFDALYPAAEKIADVVDLFDKTGSFYDYDKDVFPKADKAGKAGKATPPPVPALPAGKVTSTTNMAAALSKFAI